MKYKHLWQTQGLILFVLADTASSPILIAWFSIMGTVLIVASFCKPGQEKLSEVTE